MAKREILLGEYNDNDPWIIEDDCVTNLPHFPCRHAVPSESVYAKNAIDGAEFESKMVKIPKAIIAFNEGGYNCTILCWDCVKEAVNG